MRARPRVSAFAVTLALVVVVRPATAQTPAPRAALAVLDDLLATDRRYSEASARTDLTTGLSAMLADDAVMILSGKTHEGKAAIVDALRTNADNARSRSTWTPLAGAVSADGTHGFTFGVMTLEQPDTTKVPLKYLSYWVKGPSGWRVIAYKRGRAAEGTVSPASYRLSQPPTPEPPSADAATRTRHEDSLAAAERAFSDEAQRIGLGPAFARFGSPEAVNMGGPAVAGFLVGADAIAQAIGEGAAPPGSPVSWWPDKVIVASSGDLGVSIGTIRRNSEVPPGQPATVPFFTVWRRASVSAPWRYVAE